MYVFEVGEYKKILGTKQNTIKTMEKIYFITCTLTPIFITPFKINIILTLSMRKQIERPSVTCVKSYSQNQHSNQVLANSTVSVITIYPNVSKVEKTTVSLLIDPKLIILLES